MCPRFCGKIARDGAPRVTLQMSRHSTPVRRVPAILSNIGLRGAHRVDTSNCCQGLWSVDAQTPPGPEGSNGSLIHAAAVLWQHFLPCDGC